MQYYGQHGEDRFLDQVFQGQTAGTCVEVGAHNGVVYSNTLFFEQRGWRCLLVEPNPALCTEIRKVRVAEVFECAASSVSGEVTLHIPEQADVLSTVCSQPPVHSRMRSEGGNVRTLRVAARTLDDILSEASVDQLEFVSIDVEGYESEVLKGLSLSRWRPRVLIVEDNSDCQDNAVPRYLRSMGYVRFFRTGCNDWYAARHDRALCRPAAVLEMMVYRHYRRLRRACKAHLPTVLISGLRRFKLAFVRTLGRRLPLTW
jgi:FkbM family methyltransferase